MICRSASHCARVLALLLTPIAAFAQEALSLHPQASFGLEATGRYLIRAELTSDPLNVPTPYQIVEALRTDKLPKVSSAYELFRYPPMNAANSYFHAEGANIAPYVWYLIDASSRQGAKVSIGEAWELAYSMQMTLAENPEISFFVEPDLRMSGLVAAAGSCSSVPQEQDCHERKFKCTAKTPSGTLKIDGSPSCKWKPHVRAGDATFSINWPLELSRLLEVQNQNIVTWRPPEAATGIAILDTGYFANHPALPKHLDVDWALSFVDGYEKKDQAIDPGKVGNCGHGTATMALLAAGNIEVCEGAETSVVALGGAPSANVLPIRIAESVGHFWTSSMAAGIAYAAMPAEIQKSIYERSKFKKAYEPRPSVISISMGGVASRAWADAVNLAYELGVVVVAAAGNNFGNLPTPHLVYPARFHRAIAVVGTTWDSRPYIASPPDISVMQGNYGPRSLMASALSAYTPNAPWAGRRNGDFVLDLGGAGTSAATPQVAAAAAHVFEYCNDLLIKNFPGDGYAWKRGQFVRNALWSSANTDLNEGKPVSETFGWGQLNTAKAISMCIDERMRNVHRAPIDSVNWPFFRILMGLGEPKEGQKPERQHILDLEVSQPERQHMLDLEARQIVMAEGSPELQMEIAEKEEDGEEDWIDNKEDLKKRILELFARIASRQLNERVGQPRR